MLNDADLTGLLRLSFDEATQDLTPSHGLATQLRRQHTAARRRRATVRIAVPTVALATAGIALATHDNRSAPAKVADAPHHHGTTHARAGAAVKAAPRLVAYTVRLSAKGSAAGDCLRVGASPSAYDWLVEDGPGCVVARVGFVHDLPDGAKPLNIAGAPDLFGISDDSTRTVFAKVADARTRAETGDSWFSVVLPASASDSQITKFFVADSS